MKIKFKNGTVVKSKGPLPKKIKKSQVIRSISAMDKEKPQQSQQQQQQQASAESTSKKGEPGGSAADQIQDEFYNTGRIGRRNAMPDILGNNAAASSGADLPLKLSALTTNESTSSQTMNVNEAPNKTNNK